VARKRISGTPGRSAHYVWPRDPWRFVRPALALLGLAAAFLVVAQVSGWRRPIMPGAVISQHAEMEARCEECHTTAAGVSNLRCQRCHDPAGAGRMTNGAHVLFGSRDARKAAAAPELGCAECHVEHRRRDAALGRVDQDLCSSCHFRSLRGHPEFAVLRAASVEVPGLKFTHDRHVAEVVKRHGGTVKGTCTRCHEPTPGGRDIDPIAFDRHCAECHVKDGSVGPIDPVAQEDALPPEAILAAGEKGVWLQRTETYEMSRGKVARTATSHRDGWVLYNLARLRRELDPEGYAAERGALLARLSQLERRLALARPLAELDLPALGARRARVESEKKGAEARLSAARTAAVPAAAGLARLDEVAGAAASAGDASAAEEARRFQAAAAQTRPAAAGGEALPSAEYDARRKELLALLDAVDAADPDLKPRADDLRRRLLSLSPGEEGTALLARVRDQRATDLERLDDEIRVRESGIQPPPAALLAAPQRAIEEAILRTRARLDDISRGPAAEGPLDAETLARKKDSTEVLAGPCVKCHIMKGAAMDRVVAARPVMFRARFVHQPHLLQADCLRCHDGIEKSKLSQDINFRGVESCRECHRAGGVQQECQTCHLYHAPVVP
jgi:hypothetical protein